MLMAARTEDDKMTRIVPIKHITCNMQGMQLQRSVFFPTYFASMLSLFAQCLLEMAHLCHVNRVKADMKKETAK